MTQKLNQIGVIGLAVMGANLARNFASKGFQTAVFNRTWERTEELLKEHGEGLNGSKTLAEFVQSLEKPRRIIVLVKAGQPVDEMLDQLLELLEPGDTIVDGGNSLYLDTEKRAKKALERKVEFIGMGISGGEEGALHGPSIMPGMSEMAWEHWQNYLEKIAAKDFDGGPCVTRIGPEGAGHFVKMVHNGIEYAIMQFLAEIYDWYRKAEGLNASEISKKFKTLEGSRVDSFLTEITAKVLDKRTPEGNLVDLVLDKAAQKGTGGWTSIEAIKAGIAVPSIDEAVYARVISSRKELRKEIGTATFQKNTGNFDLEKMITAGVSLAMIQGLELIEEVSKIRNWKINLAEVARIWQGGCIIRSNLLKDFREILKDEIWKSEKLDQLLKNNIDDLRKFSTGAISASLAVPVSASLICYYDGMKAVESPANLIQAMRDYFGAHTFERKDKTGIFHDNWTNE